MHARTAIAHTREPGAVESIEALHGGWYGRPKTLRTRRHDRLGRCSVVATVNQSCLLRNV